MQTAEANPQGTPSGLSFPDALVVVDSHTEGEPTRVIVDGFPELDGATMAERRREFGERWDHLRSGTVCEPRGHDAMVGALLTPPVNEGSLAGVIFFNNVGYLGMCGHGLMGLVRTLEHLGRLGTGMVRIDTPVGTVGARLGEGGLVTVRNNPARVHLDAVEVEVPGFGKVAGQVAYGGNWFFMVHLEEPRLDLKNVPELTQLTQDILAAVRGAGITGEDGALIDHVELTGPPFGDDADVRTFVLCPGGVYDRSPCGTGTSAKLAVLHAQGRLEPGRKWRQQSVTGGLFTGWLEEVEGILHPVIQGRAWITSESSLRFDPTDPFRSGFTTAE
jgi:4-hydroxyproline epimerase